MFYFQQSTSDKEAEVPRFEVQSFIFGHENPGRCDYEMERLLTLLQSMEVLVNHLNPPTPCNSEHYIKVKINLNFYFHTSFWCFRRFYEGIKVNHQRDPQKECATLFICKKETIFLPDDIG